MIHELPYRRLLVLTEGHLGVFSAKTGVSIARYRRDDVVGLLDGQAVDRPLPAGLSDLESMPVFGRVADALELKPDAVLIGVAPVGGELPDAMRAHVVDGLRHGLSIISGLHTALAGDPELATLAERHDGRIHDVRLPGPVQRIAQGQARNMPVKRVLTVGTDCSTGKMVAALELRRAAREAGLDAAFVATGQTGIMIEGWGIAVDHVLSDFTAGAAEMLVEHVAEKEICFIEGQGSIAHPGYSGVTLSLLHGTCPDAMILCHRPGRQLHSEWPDCPIAPVVQQIALYEQALASLHPGKVVGIAVNTAGMSEAEADREIASLADRTGLPAADPVRDGPGLLLEAVRRHVDRLDNRPARP